MFWQDVKLYNKVQPMELLDMEDQRDGLGQNYGYIVYKKYVPKFSTLKIIGRMGDRLQVISLKNE